MYFHKDSELFLYLRDMKENVPVIYAAPLQGFTEVAWRNAHAQCLGGVDAYYTPFVRLEKKERFVTRTGATCRLKRTRYPGWFRK